MGERMCLANFFCGRTFVLVGTHAFFPTRFDHQRAVQIKVAAQRRVEEQKWFVRTPKGPLVLSYNDKCRIRQVKIEEIQSGQRAE